MSIRDKLIKYISKVGRSGRSPSKLFYPQYYSNILGGVVKPDDFYSLINAMKGYVYVCANQNAISVAQTPLRLYAAKDTKQKTLFRSKPVEDNKLEYMSKSYSLYKYVDSAVEVEEITEHPFLDLMKNVNSWDNSFDLLQRTELHQELVGNTYWYIVFNNLGLPHELWILPPDKISVIPDKEKYVRGYTYDKGFQKVEIPAEEIIHFKMPSATDLYYGQGPLASAVDYYNIDRQMNEYELSIFKNQARPDVAIVVDGKLTDEQFDRMKQDHSDTFRGVGNTSKAIVLEDGTDIKPINFSPKELSFLLGRSVIKEGIANAFGVPISMLTSTNVNRANADSGSTQYKRDTVLPRLRRIEQKINEKLLPYWDERLFVAFDNPVPADRVNELKENVEYVKNGIKTANEVRSDLGLDPIEGADELKSGGSKFEVNEKNPFEEEKKDLQEEAIEIERELDKWTERVYG